MMKLVLLCCLVVVAYAAPQLKLPQTSEAELESILATKEGAKLFVNCVKNPKACKDSRATAIARLAPLLLRTQGRCKGIKGVSCDAQDEKNIRYVVGTLSTKYNDLYNDLVRSLLKNI